MTERLGTHSNVYEITPLPCPICEKPVTSLRLTIREGAEEQVGHLLLRENDTIAESVALPCGHAVAGWMSDELGNLSLVTNERMMHGQARQL